MIIVGESLAHVAGPHYSAAVFIFIGLTNWESWKWIQLSYIVICLYKCLNVKSIHALTESTVLFELKNILLSFDWENQNGIFKS